MVFQKTHSDNGRTVVTSPMRIFQSPASSCCNIAIELATPSPIFDFTSTLKHLIFKEKNGGDTGYSQQHCGIISWKGFVDERRRSGICKSSTEVEAANSTGGHSFVEVLFYQSHKNQKKHKEIVL